jgi:hypothetical protein
MTIATISSDLRTAFSTSWTSTPASRVKWPNTRFEPPATFAWVEFNIVLGRTRNAIIGNTSLTSRVNGVVEINIFIPLNTGVSSGYTLSEAAKAIFNNKQFNRTQCLAGTITEVGQRKVGSDSVEYFQFRVSVPFYSYI